MPWLELRLDPQGAFINLTSYGKSRPKRIIRVKTRGLFKAFIDLTLYGNHFSVCLLTGCASGVVTRIN